MEEIAPELALIDRFLAGRCTPAEEAELRSWSGGWDGYRSLADAVRSVVQGNSADDIDVSRIVGPAMQGVSEVNEEKRRSVWRYAGIGLAAFVDSQSAWAKVEMRNQTASSQISDKSMFSRKALRRWVEYGAACCILAASTWWILSSRNQTAHTATYNTYATRPGQRASITLGDGSRVTLGPATTLRVNRTTSVQQAVSVEVIGEALFTVNHTARRSFGVVSHGVITHVLGTEFVVRAYDPSQIRIAVREGRVSVKSPVFTSANAAVVTAGEAALVTPNALPSVAPISDLATDFAWAEGDMALRDVPLGEAFVRLSRWYGMNFQVADSSLLPSRITAHFPTVFNEDEIKGLANIIGARVTRSGNTVTFLEAR